MNKSLDEIFEISNQNDFIIALSERVFTKKEKVGFANMSEPEQTVLCIVSLEGEVNNGGFDQYFFNSSGDYTHPTLPALERIEANHTAGLFREAMSVFEGSNPSSDRDQRWKQMDKFGDFENKTLSELDDKFYEYKDNLTELLYNYARSHRSQFE